MGGLLAAFMAELALVTYRSSRKSHRPPVPSEFVAAVVVFGALSLVAEASDQLAALTGWGLVVATALNVLPTAPGASTQPGAAASQGQFYSQVSQSYPGLYGPKAVIPTPPPPNPNAPYGGTNP